MLRDRDIYILEVLVDWLTNKAGYKGAWKHRDYNRLDSTTIKGFLNQIATALAGSQFADHSNAIQNGQWEPDSEARDWFIVDATLAMLNSAFGTAFSFADQAERDAFRADMLNELANLQPISAEYPQGEPLPFEDRLTFTSVTNLPGSLYPTARIYEVQ